MSDEFTPHEIATVDQWLASIDDNSKAPLAALAEMLEETGDSTITYLRIARKVIRQLEHGSTTQRVWIGMSYVGLLFLLHRRKDASK